MRQSQTLSSAMRSKRLLRSLALNVHFKHPSLGMKQYEILTRATAFLLSVDPLSPENKDENRSTTSDHLVKSRSKRESLLQKDYSYKPAGGKRRNAADLNWLEFCPGKFRPLAHVLASSHVLSPWLWKNYYPQPWLENVSQEHVTYSLEVYDDEDSSSPNIPRATFALNPYPINHPDNMDLAIIHLKDEESALKQMESLGVEMMYLKDINKSLYKDDDVVFDGFEIAEEHYDAVNDIGSINTEKKKTTESSDEDTRIFIPYNDNGNIQSASDTRYLASTETPLPEGLCGCPVIDTDGKVCGIVEGIVPKDHNDKNLAGAAAFIPHFRLHEFIDYAEKLMLEEILPQSLFNKVVSLKDGKALNEGQAPLKFDSKENLKEGIEMDATFESMVESMKKAHSPEEVEAILGTVEREKQEVLDIIETEGGDVDEIIAQVRMRTRQKQAEIVKQMETKNEKEERTVAEKKSE